MSDLIIGKWNYRVIRYPAVLGVVRHEIQECHYDNGTKPDSIPHSWSTGPTYPCGETPEDLAEDLRMMLRATELPTLEEHNGKLREVEQ